MTAPLYTPHSRALTVLYADLESHALLGSEAFEGTAGAVIERENAAGYRFYAHQYYDGERKQQCQARNDHRRRRPEPLEQIHVVPPYSRLSGRIWALA